MFFLIERVETVSLAPQFFNANLQKEVHRALRAKMEGKCSGRWGYTIAITTVYPLGKGRLDEDSGYAHFEVKYISLVMRPFKNEIIMAKVHTITNVCIDTWLLPDSSLIAITADLSPALSLLLCRMDSLPLLGRWKYLYRNMLVDRDRRAV